MATQIPTHVSKPLTALFLKTSSLGKELLGCFRSFHLAIVLLSLLAIGTLIGVVFPQEGMNELSDIQAQYGTNFKFFRTLGFFNVYSSFWFLTLQVLFFFNLLIGSFKWLKPATLAAVQRTFVPPELMLQKTESYSLACLVTGSQSALEKNITQVLKHFRYQVFSDGAGNLYACKGNISRLGPCLAHIGILMCILGGLYSCFMGFKALRTAVPGDVFSIYESDSFKTNVSPDIWLGSVPEWKIRVNDFKMELYPGRPDVVKQYYSTLDVLSPEGKVLKSQTISVNTPLVMDSVSIYQASYAPTGRFFIKVDGRPITMTLNNEFNKRAVSVTRLWDGSNLMMFPFFANQDPGVEKNNAVFFVRRPGEPVSTGKMPPNIRLNEGQTGSLNGKTIAYVRPEIATGLQIKQAPEIPWMYTAYLIIATGSILCFFSQRQIWIALRKVAQNQHEVMLHPKTNKARLSFQKELATLHQTLQAALVPKNQTGDTSHASVH